MAAIFARAFFEPALTEIGTNIVESVVAGSNWVESTVVVLLVGAGSVDAGFFRHSSASGWCTRRLGRVFEVQRGAISGRSFESMKMRHCRVVVVVIGRDGGADKIFANFFSWCFVKPKNARTVAC